MLTDVACWARLNPAIVIEVRGCCIAGEVSLKQSKSLAAARGEHAVRFLAETCSLGCERCRLSSQTGEGHPGVEIRALFRLEVDGLFVDEGNHLADDTVLDVIATDLRGRPTRRAAVEVGAGEDRQAAKRRCQIIQQLLLSRGLPRHTFAIRIIVDSIAMASFYLFEEIPSIEG